MKDLSNENIVHIKNNGLEIKEGINPALDYIKVIDNYYFKEEV